MGTAREHRGISGVGRSRRVGYQFGQGPPPGLPRSQRGARDVSSAPDDPVLLVGLVLSAVWGWSWADPIAALVIAGIAVKEGVEAWRGEHCDDCASLPAVDAATGQGSGCTDGCCTDRTA